LTAEFGGTAALMAAAALAETFITAADMSPQAQRWLVSVIIAIVVWALMRALRRVNGDHLNPIATVAGGIAGDFSASEFFPAVAIVLLLQAGGALVGGWLVSIVVARPSLMSAPSLGSGSVVSEMVAGGGVALLVALAPATRRAVLVGIFSGLLFWFTDTSGLGNPAVAFGRVIVDGPYHLLPEQAAMAAGAQLAGAAIAVVVALALRATRRTRS
jgi:glycerol uptake facilitator-like aquaporin